MSTILVDNIKSFSGTNVTVSGSSITVQGDTSIQGHLTASGNVTLGDSTLDTISIQGKLTGSNGMFITGGGLHVDGGGLANPGFATLDVGTVQIGRTDIGTGTIELKSQTTASNGLIVSGTNSHLKLDGDIIAPNIPKAAMVHGADLSTSLGSLLSGEFYTMSGSQLFSASAFIDPSRPAATVQPFVSASLFVFRKA